MLKSFIQPTVAGFLLMALPALAGVDVSGGGNALVCFDNPAIARSIVESDRSIQNEHIPHITSLEVLDLVEASYRSGLTARNPAPLLQPFADETPEEYARRIVSRIRNFDPKLHQLFRDRIDAMPADQAIAQPAGLAHVSDYNLFGRIDKRNCVIATLAIHLKERDVFSLYFDDRLFFHPKNSAFSRDVLYLHEVIYSVARFTFDHENSRNTRKLIGLLLREQVSFDELRKMQEATHFLTSPYMGDRRDGIGLAYQELNEKTKKWFQANSSGYFDCGNKKEALLPLYRTYVNQELRPMIRQNGDYLIQSELAAFEESMDHFLEKELGLMCALVVRGETDIYQYAKPSPLDAIKTEYTLP